ncbi:MAG: hypothetical protein IPJ74_01880 [Saprospiraceae bacterium]|nr:hypothetical protein [Saprospiraceae bacterium]
MGLGYIYNGKRSLLGVGFTLGSIALAYVELNLQKHDTTLWDIMFSSVFVINTCYAIDGYKEAQEINK